MERSTYNHWEPESLNGENSKTTLNYYGDIMPYEDPAIVNPDELATFPKQVKNDEFHGHHHHPHHPLHFKSTPVRDGRNITRTDNHPEKNGFI